MLRAAVAVLACLCVARSSLAEPYNLRLYTQNPKDYNSILASIEERLRVLDTISAAQAKQARRLDIVQDKLDRVEHALTLKLERIQLAAERVEHRLHMLQTNMQTTIKESSEKLERSQIVITELTQNLTNHIVAHKHLLEKVNGAYADTWHRGLVLEGLMRDGLSLVNVTRRELADGLRALARVQRDSRVNSGEIDTVFTKRLTDHTVKIDLKMQELLSAQKEFLNSCREVQQDDPKPVADVLEKLIESLIKMKLSTTHELAKLQNNINVNDNKIMKTLSTQNDLTCRRLENAFRNTSHTILKENELRQLTEKFVSLTDRADAALLRLEAQIKSDVEEPLPKSEVTAEADRLLQKLGYDRDTRGDSREYYDLEDADSGYFDDNDDDSMSSEDKLMMREYIKSNVPARTQHRRHLHKHPYDRGPKLKNRTPT